MKKKALYFLGVLILFAVIFDGCKKGGLKRLSSLPDSLKTDSAAHGTLSTITAGNYNYIAADNNGNVYALHFNYGADTIFKFDASGTKSIFYLPPPVTESDTLVKQTMRCLTIDSLGNIYTIDNMGISTVDVLKIAPDGSASTILSSFAYKDNMNVQTIAVNQGNFYYGDYEGIYKITSDGSQTLIIPGISDFTVNKDGIIFYPEQNTNGQFDIVQQLNTGANKLVIAGPDRTDDLNGDKDVVFDQVVGITIDRHSNLYIAEASDTRATIHKMANLGKISEVISTPFDHVDGPLITGAIGVPFSIVTDASGNLYFSEFTASPPDIRKITF